MTQLTVDVQLDERGRPVFRLTEAQAAALGLQPGAAREARWEVQLEQTQHGQSSLSKYIGIVPRLEEGSLDYYRRAKGHTE